MKIYSKKEFIKLPANTLYMDYEPCVFGEIQIKTSGPDYHSDNDFVSEQVALSTIPNHIEHTSDDYVGFEFRFEDGLTSRDAIYDETQLYAIFDNQDIDQLVTKLLNCKH